MCAVYVCMLICVCVHVCVRGTDLFPHREDRPCLIREGRLRVRRKDRQADRQANRQTDRKGEEEQKRKKQKMHTGSSGGRQA